MSEIFNKIFKTFHMPNHQQYNEILHALKEFSDDYSDRLKDNEKRKLNNIYHSIYLALKSLTEKHSSSLDLKSRNITHLPHPLVR